MRHAPITFTVIVAALILSGSLPAAAAMNSASSLAPQTVGAAAQVAAAAPTTPRPNRPPVTINRSLSVAKDTPTALTLTASDPDRQPLTFVTSVPGKGTLTGTAPNLTYTPSAGYTGFDLVVFRATDPLGASDQSNVYISVYAPPNHPPTARSEKVTTRQGQPVTITLRARDQDRDPLRYALLTWSWCHCSVEHGAITGSGTSWTYTPASGYTGADSLEFRATDDEGAFADGIVDIQVRRR